jgi:MFS family permease
MGLAPLLHRAASPWRGLEGLPAAVWILSAATLLNRAGTMALPFLVLYLTKGLGLPAAQAGQAFVAYGLAAMAAAPVGGWLADRLGHLRVMMLSLAVSGLLLFALPLLLAWPAVLALTVAWSFAGEAFRPASMAILTDLAPVERRKAVFALNRLAINLGMSVGPAVGGFLAVHSFKAIFWLDGATSLLSAAVILAFVKVPAHLRAPGQEADAPASRGAWRDAAFLAFILAALPVLVVFFQHEGPLPVFLVRDLGHPESFYGLLFTVNTLLIVALEVQLNLATSHWPHRRTFALGSCLYALGFGAMAFLHTKVGILATVVAWTFGEMMLLPAFSDYVAHISPPDRRGEYMGVWGLGIGVAFAFGPWLGTWMLDRVGAFGLWSLMGGLGLVSAGLLAKVRVPSTAGRGEM